MSSRTHLVVGAVGCLVQNTEAWSLPVVSRHSLGLLEHGGWLPEANIPTEQDGNTWQFHDLPSNVTVPLLHSVA